MHSRRRGGLPQLARARARSIRRDRYGGLCIAAAEILCIEMAGASPAMTIPCERSVPY
jgi:hypothetical protein